MAITTTCSGCGKTLAVADEFAGRQARCPQCGQIYTVPSAPSAGSSPLTPLTGSPLPSANSGPFDLGNPTSMPTQAASMETGVQYWMKAPDGREYGPADNATLARWFSEGRVGPGYQIRAGESGHWQPASSFQAPVSGGSVNPYATYPAATGMGVTRQYPKSDQSGLVLAMGILSWIVCPICGVIAWVMGGQALKDMQQGTADPTNRGLVQVGYYLGMVNVILAVCCGGFYIVIIAIVAIGGNM
jgi:phage FluMu protein Com